ncbi:type II secretion system protein GspD [Mucilaginibacter sp. OK283]|jgi:type IV pilus assembly protein PilQ|uniref:type II secretion system protein GspD n=1 Tax=Mucilaginibacter sp. OK283 TaxID=1881049 RepID=UPI0008B45B1A|nr:general secretion pathway protein GspD [Mucilaginibacter sp. OK283]SEO10793.1 type IV pilus assembly protein PilQ [Mucilaginibacter sp. OK283]
MLKKITCLIICFYLFTAAITASAQQQDRLQVIKQKLDELATDVPGLNQKVQLLVTGVSIHEYLNAIARSNNLSISSDPGLNFSISDTFTGVSASNILLLLAQKYNLDIAVVGSIINITPYRDPNQFLKPPPKELGVKYNAANNTLSLSLNNDSLAAAAKRITQLSGKNIVVPGSLQGKTVTSYIADAPFETALGKLAYANEIKMVHTADDFYLFQPLDENEEVYVNGDKNTGVRKSFRNTAQPGAAGASGLFVRQVNGQKLISVDAVNSPIIDLVKRASQETGKNYSIYSDIKGSITLHVNDVSYDDLLTLLFKSTEYTFHAEKGIYVIGDRKLEGLRTFRAIHLQNRAIDTVITMIPSEWKRGIEIKEFREQNTLLLSGSGAQIDEVESFIKQMDVLVPVVLIEVTMIDVHKTRSVSTGISAGVSDSVKTGGTVLPGIDYTFGAKGVNDFLNSVGKATSLNLGHVVPNFYVRLQALENNNNIDVRSVPKLTALNGHSATLSIGSKRYYKNTTQNVIPSIQSAQSIFTNVYQEVNADLSIAIKPIVSGDDQVTLGIRINISDFTAIPTDGSPPPQAISKFETSLRVHSEDTIVLGGLERTETDDSGSGIPLLSRIPILKWIFSSRTRSKSKVVTVLFIKSTIIR